MSDAFGRFRPSGPMKEIWFRRPAYRLGPRRIFHGGYRPRAHGPSTMKHREERMRYENLRAEWEALADETAGDGNPRVLDQDAIDSLLGRDDDLSAEWEAMESLLDQEAIDAFLRFDGAAPPPEDGWRTMTPRERARALGGYHAVLAEPFLSVRDLWATEDPGWTRQDETIFAIVDALAKPRRSPEKT